MKMEKKKKTESKITEKKTINTSSLDPKVKNKTETEWKPNHLQTTFPWPFSEKQYRFHFLGSRFHTFHKPYKNMADSK